MKSCEECKFAIFADFGYSNWTVEGTEFSCAKNAHPAGSFDRWYGEEKHLEFAEICPTFEAGDAIYMDCDCEQIDTLTPEQRIIWEGRNADAI